MDDADAPLAGGRSIILALADAQYRRRSDELTVVYLLDQSLSIPAADRQAMLKYVETSLEGSGARSSTTASP